MESVKPVHRKKKTNKKSIRCDKLHKRSKKCSSSVKSKKKRSQKKPNPSKKANLRQAKGWKDAAPKRGNERKEMIHRCGSSCFLLPHELKFPVCRMSRRCNNKTDGSCGCVIDRRGVIAAKFRARQWGYHTVEKKADDLLAHMDKRGVSELNLSRGKTLESIF